MEAISEIRQIISDFGGEVILDTPIIIKLTPHSRPEVIKEKIDNNFDFDKYSVHAIYTIRQRLKLLQFYKNQKHGTN